MGDLVNRYLINDSIVFKKNNDEYGYFSNMSSKYKLNINGIEIQTVEALYQSLKFSENEEIQKEILEQKSPMAAKYKARKYIKFIRNDWEEIKLEVMETCLRIKIFENYDSFSNMLMSTENKNIVENSDRDSYWGAKISGNFIEGENNLGVLLMNLRDEIAQDKFSLKIPKNLNLKLFGKNICEFSKNSLNYEQISFL